MSNKMELKDYLHLYLGCNVKVPDGRIGILNTVAHEDSAELCEVLLTIEDEDSGFYGEPESDGIKTEKLKPILRPLSDIQDEEKKEVYRLIFQREFPESGRIFFKSEKTFYEDPRWMLLTGVDRVAICITGTVWADCDLHSIKYNQHLITKYLLSKAFDLFDLIKSGLAIDSTTLKERTK